MYFTSICKSLVVLSSTAIVVKAYIRICATADGPHDAL